MKRLFTALVVTAGLFGVSGTASAQYGPGHSHHGHGHGRGYGGGWGGGHYHVPPAHTHYHPDPWGGHLHYHQPRPVYHRGPDFVPAYGGPRVYQPYGYGYQPGFSFGFQYNR